MIKEEKLVEMVLDDIDHGAFAISIVENPAIESDFLALSTDMIKLKVADADKHTLTGAILIPDKPILRIDENGDPYHIYFKPETVLEMSERYLKNYNQSEVTLEHAVDAQDITLVETWIKIDEVNDKSVALGIDAPVGSWVGTMKVDNPTVWEEFIKTGTLKGFSIEAKLKTKEKMSEEIKKDFWADIKTELSCMIDKLVPKQEEEIKEEVKVEELMSPVEERLLKLEKNQEAVELLITKLTEMITEKEQPEPQEVVEEVKDEVKEEEVKEEVKEEVEMMAVTDESEKVIEKPAFDVKLTTAQRVQQALTYNI